MVATVNYVYEAQAWLVNVKGETWRWFTALSQHEWMVLLGIVAALGFLCMRGFTNRGTL
jgi:hypothetical protein